MKNAFHEQIHGSRASFCVDRPVPTSRRTAGTSVSAFPSAPMVKPLKSEEGLVVSPLRIQRPLHRLISSERALDLSPARKTIQDQ